MEQYVVTISRQFGSMGRTIAENMSKILNVDYLDRDIVEATAKRMGMSVKAVSDAEESAKPTLLRKKYPFNMGIYSITDEIFAVQKNIIRDMASKESCIIVGRCADSILRDFENRLNIYIYAPYEARMYNCVHELMMDEKTAAKMIKEVDAARTNYQRKYCPEIKSVFDHKDIMIDSSRFGIEGTAKVLAQIVLDKWGNQL
jgi:cytidylate kinase